MKQRKNNKTLMEGCAWLQDDDLRNARIFEVVERNSVIEGLPPLSEAFRQRLDRKYRTTSD